MEQGSHAYRVREAYLIYCNRIRPFISFYLLHQWQSKKEAQHIYVCISGVYNYVELFYSKFSCLSQRSWSSNITRVTILVQILKYTSIYIHVDMICIYFYLHSILAIVCLVCFFSSSLPPHNLEPVGPRICTKHLTSIASAPWLFSRHWQRKGPRKNRN